MNADPAAETDADVNLGVARRLYAAFEDADPAALMELLDPGFRGEVTAGLPEGWGGTYEGPEEMLRDCWAQVFAKLDTRPVPEEYLLATDGRVVVHGRYLGRARHDDRPHEAAFVHILAFLDGRISRLVQVTDSARWEDAIAYRGEGSGGPGPSGR